MIFFRPNSSVSMKPIQFGRALKGSFEDSKGDFETSSWDTRLFGPSIFRSNRASATSMIKHLALSRDQEAGCLCSLIGDMPLSKRSQKSMSASDNDSHSLNNLKVALWHSRSISPLASLSNSQGLINITIPSLRTNLSSRHSASRE